jgi:hypothetical protein
VNKPFAIKPRLSQVIDRKLIIAGAISAFLSMYFQTKFLYYYDYSYFADINRRLEIGQIPYRDFDLVVAPGTFYLHHAFSTLVGSSSLTSQLLAVLLGIATTLTYLQISLIFARNSESRLIRYSPYILVPLIGPTYVVSFPLYDAFATLAVGISIIFTIKILANQKPSTRNLIAMGMLASLPLAFKQNVGLIYLATFITMMGVSQLRQLSPIRNFLWSTLGAGIPLVTVAIFLSITGVIDDFIVQNFTYASEAKGVGLTSEIYRYADKHLLFIVIVISIFLSVKKLRQYSTLLPIVLGGLVSLISLLVILVNIILEKEFPLNRPLINWLWILPVCVMITANFLIKRNETDKRAFIASFLLLGALLGAYLSQGYRGSSYSWGGGYLVICYIAITAFKVQKSRYEVIVILLLMSTSLWYLGYSALGERYADRKFTSQKFELDIRNIQDGYLPMLSEDRASIRQLRNYFENRSASIVELPMEDPLILVKADYQPYGRCTQLIWITCLDSKKASNQLLSSPPDFFIIKNDIQLPWNPEPEADAIIFQVKKCLVPQLESAKYTVYKSTEEGKICLRSGR